MWLGLTTVTARYVLLEWIEITLLRQTVFNQTIFKQYVLCTIYKIVHKIVFVYCFGVTASLAVDLYD